MEVLFGEGGGWCWRTASAPAATTERAAEQGGQGTHTGHAWRRQGRQATTSQSRSAIGRPALTHNHGHSTLSAHSLLPAAQPVEQGRPVGARLCRVEEGGWVGGWVGRDGESASGKAMRLHGARGGALNVSRRRGTRVDVPRCRRARAPAPPSPPPLSRFPGSAAGPAAAPGTIPAAAKCVTQLVLRFPRGPGRTLPRAHPRRRPARAPCSGSWCRGTCGFARGQGRAGSR